MRLFKPTYTDRKTGAPRTSSTYNISFRDHLNRRQTIAAAKRETVAQKIADHVEELVDCRRKNSSPPEKLQRWLDAIPDKLRSRLIDIDLINRRMLSADKPLKTHIEGEKDAEGKTTEPGYAQVLAAKGVTQNHADQTAKRACAVLDGCGMAFWSDLLDDAAADKVSVWLGDQRTAGKIRGTTFNYYVRDFRSVCRWLAKRMGSKAVPMAELARVVNADSDKETRRPLTVPEMPLLQRAAANGIEIHGLTGDERSILYRFAFETGIRPNQIRALTVTNFNLDARPPTVTSEARWVKIRASIPKS